MVPTARSVFRFIVLLSFVAFAPVYLLALLGTCELVGGGEDVCLRSQKISAQASFTWAVVTAIVLVVSLIATKLSPKPRTTDAYLRDKAWNTNSGYSREAPAGVLTFERAPLAALQVAESGPSLGTSAIHIECRHDAASEPSGTWRGDPPHRHLPRLA